VVDLSRLNPEQRAAATHEAGPMLVLAGAGSGKTRVITTRIAHLLERGTPPQAICAVTFTNKAAAEMRERVSALVKNRDAASKLTIGTFHSLGLAILHAERRALGMPGGFVIYDQADQLGALREAMRGSKEYGDAGERRFDVKAIMARISLAKNAFILPEQYEATGPDEYDHATERLYPRYQAAMQACGAFDFDDLICTPVQLFARDPDAHRRWAARFQYVMVDEYQDTNRAQLELVRVLVANHGNLVVVGDDDQSIYSWRGADPTNILRFAEMFPGARTVKLEQNYRSTKTVLDAANAVIANNTKRHGKTLWSQLGQGEPITHAVAATVEDEAKWVVREIARLGKDGLPWSHVAVMYRSNVQAKLLEEELRAASVPYIMFGGQQFFERKEVKDLLAYLRVALNPKDDLALRRVLNVPARGIGLTTIERLVGAAHARHTSLWTILRELAAADALPAEVEAQAELAGVAGPARATRGGVNASGLPEAEGTGTSPPDDDDDAWGNLDDEDVVAPKRSEAPAALIAATGGARAPGQPEAERPGTPLADAIKGPARKGISAFVAAVARLAASIEHGKGVVEASRQLIADIGLADDIRHASPSLAAAQRRLQNLEGILGALGRHEEKGRGRAALVDYLRKLSLESEEKEETSGERVVMTTLHGSKGLEFPVCFIVGMEEELLPHARTLQAHATDAVPGGGGKRRAGGDDDGPSAAQREAEGSEGGDHATDISEERRLAYVGITRAQRKLYLTRACTRVARGRMMPRTPSRFLLEIPEDLLEVIDIAEEAAKKVPEGEVKDFFKNFAFDE
jgi:superfamily I DNA/RNA helicase